jgi:hypothetical protein
MAQIEEKFQLPAGFFKNTFCVFEEIVPPNLNKKHFDFVSKSGSSYYFTQQGMYRFSNHWGRLANSKWRLVTKNIATDSKFKWGFATWESFYPDNSTEKLYFIQPDFSNNSVNYQHKNAPDYDTKALLRTSFETAKKIKQIRNLLNLTSWARYFEYDTIDELRKKIILELVYTDQSLEEIKRELQLKEK